MVLAIDFDDTIHDPGNRKPGYKLGQPIPGAKEAVSQLFEAGHKVIIFCVWADTFNGVRAIADWMRYFDIPFDEVTAQKPAAHYYIDDRAVKFTSWDEVIPQLEEEDDDRIVRVPGPEHPCLQDRRRLYAEGGDGPDGSHGEVALPS